MREDDFRIGRVVHCRNKMDGDYRYTVVAPYGEVTILGYFEPFFSPKEMLELGVFEGRYLNDCIAEYPVEWFTAASLASDGEPDIRCNYFKVKSRQSLSQWRENGWLYGPDNRGWFQWYCRYYYGRREPTVDAIQIKRWMAFKRHYAQVTRNSPANDGVGGVWSRPKQRQALLQWSYPCFVGGATSTH